MDYFKTFINIVSIVNLGYHYPLFVTISACGILLFFIALTIFIKPLRQKDKTPILSLMLFFYFLCFFKVACDFSFNKFISEESLILSLLFLSLSFAEYFALSVIKSGNYYLKSSDKRLIGSLIQSINDSEDSKRDLFSSNNFKKIEFLKSEPMKKKTRFDDFGINFSAILSYIKKMKTFPISFDEKELLLNIENSIGEYSYKSLSDSERAQFSTNLCKLLKMISKYEAV